jgi:predicted helicase
VSSSKPFSSLVSNKLFSFDLLEKTQCLPLYRYDKTGKRIDNITDWGLQQFAAHYNDDTITKQQIFHYVYAVLHHPAYRKKYELNLKREFPRIPFYADFHQWEAWGERLMNLHIHYETAESYPLQIKNHETRNANDEPRIPKPKLKADKQAGVIMLDENTELHGIPAEVWEYKLGNRSALEWILDQYKESKPKDPTIASMFNTYRFADYKEVVIDLIGRVCRVSVETVKVVREMELIGKKHLGST